MLIRALRWVVSGISGTIRYSMKCKRTTNISPTLFKLFRKLRHGNQRCERKSGNWRECQLTEIPKWVRKINELFNNPQLFLPTAPSLSQTLHHLEQLHATCVNPS